MTVTFPLYFASANGFPYCLTVKSYTPFSGASLLFAGKAERRDVPATAATDSKLWRRLTALWSSSSSRTILFSSVVASKEDDDEFVGNCSLRFPPFRERHRRNVVGGLEEENDIKTGVVILGVSLSLSLLPSFTAQSFAGSLVMGTTTTFPSRGYCALTFCWADDEKKSCCFSSKRAFNLDSIHMHSLLAEAKEDISAFCCFFFSTLRRGVCGA